jgi:hypothetical protein
MAITRMLLGPAIFLKLLVCVEPSASLPIDGVREKGDENNIMRERERVPVSLAFLIIILTCSW